MKEFKNIHNPKSNFHKWKGISRKPTKKQILEGNYTLPNIRFYFGSLLRNNDLPNSFDDLVKFFPDNHKSLLKSIEKHFGEDADINKIIEKL